MIPFHGQNCYKRFPDNSDYQVRISQKKTARRPFCAGHLSAAQLKFRDVDAGATKHLGHATER